MLRTGQFYQLWLMFVLAAAAGLMIIVHIATIGKEQADLKWGFLPVAILATVNTVGRVVNRSLSDRIGRSRTMVLAFVLLSTCSRSVPTPAPGYCFSPLRSQGFAMGRSLHCFRPPPRISTACGTWA